MHLKCYHCTSCGINPVFTGLSPTYGQVTYALLTRAPVSAPKGLSLDLHVLGLSLAFILSQDQTLRCISLSFISPKGEWSGHRRTVLAIRSNLNSLTVKLFALALPKNCTTCLISNFSKSLKSSFVGKLKSINVVADGFEPPTLCL